MMKAGTRGTSAQRDHSLALELITNYDRLDQELKHRLLILIDVMI